MITYPILIERFSAWANNTPDVRAILMLGSRARLDHPADEWSDLDLILFARQHEQFIQSEAWVTEIAPLWLSFLERSGDGRTWERRALYAGGLDVDLVLNPVEWLASFLPDPSDPEAKNKPPALPADIVDMIRRGVRIVVDKDGLLTSLLALPLPETSLYQKPAPAEFSNTANDFWYHTVWSTKHLRRGEIWLAKSCVDNYLKHLLRQMIEWHTRATRGEQVDTWLSGRFLDEWADPRAVAELRQAFAWYDAQEIARALRCTMHLFRWLEDETAAAWGYTPSLEGEGQAAGLTRRLLDEM